MTQITGLFSALKTNGFSALADFDPDNDEHILATLVLAGDDDDLSTLEPHREELPRLLQTRILADSDPELIDEAFSESRFEPLEDLVRVGLDWEHPNFSDAPEELMAWMTLDEERQYILRGDDFSDDLPPAIACALDPLAFAKQIWHGEATMEWIEDRLDVADVLCRLDGAAWVVALAILSQDSDKEAFLLAAEAAIFSAAAASTAENSNEFYYDLACGNPEHDATFDLIYAAIEDPEEQEVLIQSAAVQILSQRNVDHPAIDGAPFSGSEYDNEALVAAKKIIKRDDKTPSEKMQSARLFADMITADFEEKSTLIRLATIENAAMALFLGDDESLFEAACGDDILALGAIEIILQRADIWMCLELLQKCSLYRADYVRNRLAFILK